MTVIIEGPLKIIWKWKSNFAIDVQVLESKVEADFVDRLSLIIMVPSFASNPPRFEKPKVISGRS